MRHLILTLILLTVIGIQSASAQQVEDPYDTSPEAEIMRYINALNLGDYATAYNTITPANQTFAEYVAGYGETKRIVPYLGSAGAAAGSLYETTMLLGYKMDGSVETYYGYFQLANGSNFVPPVEGYLLSSNLFYLVDDVDAIPNEVMDFYLNEPYHESARPAGIELETPGEMSDQYAEAVLDYYDLINKRDFVTAFARWLSPANGVSRDLRPVYSTWVEGYEDTAYVTAYAGEVQPVPQYLSRFYLAGFVPTVLVGQHTDGGFVAYVGCYAIGRLSGTDYGIVNGSFSLLSDGVPLAHDIFEALDDVACSELEIAV